MLQFQLMTEQDRREAAAIERRRALEEERKKRIFNPRARIFGIDHKTLDKQIEDRRQREEDEKLKDQIFEQQIQKNGRIALALDKKEKEERRKLQKEINEFRQNFQRPEDRREFDLNDPDRIKRSLPARLRDDDPRLGISCAQKFEGEDLASDERAKMQREQIRSWLDQQIQEKEAAEKEQIAADEAYKAAVLARDHRAIELDRMERECRKKLELACLRFNRALADERECQRREREHQNKQDCLAEMYNTMTSDMMTENPEVAQSSLGASRQIGYLYKGMTQAEKQAIKAIQMAQIEEAKKRRENEKRVNQEFDDYINGMQKTISMMDRELQQKQRERNKHIAEENKQMGIEHKNHVEYLEKIVYSNKPTAAYYDQFNRGTR